MYQQNTTSRPARTFSNFSQRPSSPSRGPSRSYSSRGPSRGGFSGSSRFSGPSRGGPRRRFGNIINPALFVKRAEEFTKIEETNPVHSFADFNFDPQLLANIKAKGYLKPTPIQDQLISEVLAGRDVLGVANTGTGKTAAFALPLINAIIKNPNKRILILAPTRELAQQIKSDFRDFTPGLRVYFALAIGGAFMREQIMDIRRGPNVIIGTPGRIMDLNRRRVINFAQFDTLVLDEVDRMLDMGFVADIKSIVSQITQAHQTLFFSATVDKKIEILIDTFLKNPVKVALKTTPTSSHVEQDVVRVPRYEKEGTLCKLLKQEEFKKVLVFTSTKLYAEKLTLSLKSQGFSVDSLHGDKRQSQRVSVIRGFKEDQLKIVVATDVAARGLDIHNITHVINFDQPATYDDYIHRIGRTGRADQKGYALTFIDP
ncbi:MAG: DNA/RNA helicase, superfamily II [Candidatus Shapirobacteria bacterium GW2011_GWE1_38_10]|uniref:DNA/RNA helicase, superfamily II n=1 Tax=Candidatus Shapirobacteria bacterium GW2011_GWE1_38_10 TaxID=1618488 RepID=A0A0G0KLX5_9BACT|nr:MAG: DNA/RNA helicase, superfamily II [Candidatus Shapirobacteria bacterium GW2011_GWF2_37_20]KKQ50174.1 MAG: DNA/RNA helicase, superfamily II [Candidatus Shapirobacteria bacterium GW2011_GWE1_38_10]KKQ64767.1 MAG: DNA/RNA helicase, superfamily II [Candidatus Shapirobacteria bacterium GW2011_GWF1_38_23]HBP51418.1 ATP-dependent helicase [Candidatus Shapirobacteria bacterium]